jgi:hypothetical protein
MRDLGLRWPPFDHCKTTNNQQQASVMDIMEVRWDKRKA